MKAKYKGYDLEGDAKIQISLLGKQLGEVANLAEAKKVIDAGLYKFRKQKDPKKEALRPKPIEIVSTGKALPKVAGKK